MAGFAAFALSSCTTVEKTATTIDVANSLTQTGEVDLEVSPNRITYNFRPTNKERARGKQNVINSAVREALRSSGGGDVLVAPEYEIQRRKGLFGPAKIKEVIVYGYPAKYKNFRHADK